jgi:putative hydrolase of the HAD superfamily
VKAILLDLDDTLLDYSGDVEDSWAQACDAGCAGSDVDVARLVEVLGPTRRWFWDDPVRHRVERVDMPGAWRKIAAYALERLGRPDEKLADTIMREYRALRRARMRLYPEALACLERLRARGLGLALVTNGDAREQRYKIERWDLARFFDAIVIEGEFGAGKPDEAVYRHALGKLAVPPTDAGMVGDHLENDVDGPQRLGLRGIWLDREGRGLPAECTVRPWRIVRSLEQIPV